MAHVLKDDRDQLGIDKSFLLFDGKQCKDNSNGNNSKPCRWNTGGQTMQERDNRSNAGAKITWKCQRILADLYNEFRLKFGGDSLLLFEEFSVLLRKAMDGNNSFLQVNYNRTLGDGFFRNELGSEAYSRFSEDVEFLARFRQAVNEVNLSYPAPGTELGDLMMYFFELALRDRKSGVMGTPASMARNIVETVFCLGDGQVERVLDAFCGSAACLIEANRYLLQINPSFVLYGPDFRLLGLERDARTRKCATNLLRFYGMRAQIVGFTRDFDIGDREYDLIFANPPFLSTYVRKRNTKHLGNTLWVETTDEYLVLLQQVLMGLRNGGRCAVIVPDSFLKNTASDAVQVRQRILEEYICEAVVSLPAYSFYPQTTAGASLLLLQRAEDASEAFHSNRTVLFFHVETDGYSNDSKRRQVSQNDFRELQEVIRKNETYRREWHTGRHIRNRFGRSVPTKWMHRNFWYGSYSEIADNDFSLLSDMYRMDHVYERDFREPTEVLRDMQVLNSELNELMHQLAETIHEQ